MNENEIIVRYPAKQYLPVLVSEVTRMNSGDYCIAGWDIHSHKMVRPLQASGSNWKLGTNRSVFAVGNLINCVPSGKRNSVYPHATEDLILSTPPTLLQQFDELTTYSLLIENSFNSIREIFGCQPAENKYIPDGTKCSSLGGLRVERNRVHFIEDGYHKLRLHLNDIENTVYWLPITCDHLRSIFSPVDENAVPHFGVAEANEWLCVNPPDCKVILRVGLARAWAGKDGEWSPRRCYVQLNGIVCPEDNFHIFAGPPSRDTLF